MNQLSSDQLYEIMPLYIGNKNEVPQYFKAYFLLDSALKYLNTTTIEHGLQFTTTKSYLILEKFDFPEIRQKIDAFYKKAFNLDKITVTPTLKSDFILIPRNLDADLFTTRELNVTAKQIFKIMYNDRLILDNAVNNLIYAYKIFTNLDDNEDKKIIEEAMIKNTSIILRLQKYYSEYLDQQTLDMNQLTVEDLSDLYNIAYLGIGFINAYIKLMPTPELNKTGIELCLYYSCCNIHTMINNNPEFDDEKHRKIIEQIIWIDMLGDGIINSHEQTMNDIKKYLKKYEENKIRYYNDLFEKEEEYNQKTWWKNRLFQHLYTLKNHDLLNPENEQLFNELFGQSRSDYQTPLIIFNIFDQAYDALNEQIDMNAHIIIEALNIHKFYNIEEEISQLTRLKLTNRSVIEIDFKIDFKSYNDENKKEYVLSTAKLLNELITKCRICKEMINNTEFDQEYIESIKITFENYKYYIKNICTLFNSKYFKENLVNYIGTDDIKKIIVPLFRWYNIDGDVSILKTAYELNVLYLMKSIWKICSFADVYLKKDHYYYITSSMCILNFIYNVISDQFIELKTKVNSIIITYFSTIINQLLIYYNPTITSNKIINGFEIYQCMRNLREYRILNSYHSGIYQELNKIFKLDGTFDNVQDETGGNNGEIEQHLVHKYDDIIIGRCSECWQLCKHVWNIDNSKCIHCNCKSNKNKGTDIGILSADETVLSIKEDVTKISDDYFNGNSYIKTIKFHNYITEIGNRCFASCKSLETIDLTNCPIKILPNNCFANCFQLKTIKLPNTLTKIEDYCFTWCLELESIQLPENVIEIGRNAFDYCRNLRSIFIPKSVIYIGSGAFIEVIKNIELIFENRTEPLHVEKRILYNENETDENEKISWLEYNRVTIVITNCNSEDDYNTTKNILETAGFTSDLVIYLPY